MYKKETRGAASKKNSCSKLGRKILLFILVIFTPIALATLFNKFEFVFIPGVLFIGWIGCDTNETPNK